MKKVLIVSMNPMSNTLNNGKTISSFFYEYPIKCLAQLYFSSALPESDVCENYFRISDRDVIKSRLHFSKECGGKVVSVNDKKETTNQDTPKIMKNNVSRLAREFVWSQRWKTDKLLAWLDEINPEVVFFVAGDVVFSHRIALFVKKRYKAKLVTFITDDYVLPRLTINPFWWLRRNYVFSSMKKLIKESDQLVTISQYMKDVYSELFHKDSYVAVNMTESLKQDYKGLRHDGIRLIYAGGVHFNRDKIIKKLACCIKEINIKLGMNIYLDIYSGQTLSSRQIKEMEAEGVAKFKGKVMGEELKKVLNDADILVFVESFKKKNIYDTRLSLSTKIPEYLSLGKPIFAIGPTEVSSMMYLKDVAVCVNDVNKISEALIDLVTNPKKQIEMGYNAINKYRLYHIVEKNRNDFQYMINN